MYDTCRFIYTIYHNDRRNSLYRREIAYLRNIYQAIEVANEKHERIRTTIPCHRK